MGISGSKQKSPKPICIDYDAIGRAIEGNDLHAREESDNVTGVHLRDYTILVQKRARSKYRGWDSFGWVVWIKPKT